MVFGVNDDGLFTVQRDIGPTIFSHSLGGPRGISQSDPEHLDLGSDHPL